MQDSDLIRLQMFIRKAQLARHAGNGPEHQDGDFRYRDNCAGSSRFGGQEIVYWKARPVWYQNYGGGITPRFLYSEELVPRAFRLLKRALLVKGSEDNFQPRGPRMLQDKLKIYLCDWQGSLKEFRGSERIFLNAAPVYSLEFFGGLILH